MKESGVSQRKELLEALLGALARGEWCAVIAPLGSGKTTLAKQLERAIRDSGGNGDVRLVAFKQAGTAETAWRQVVSEWGLDLEAAEKLAAPPIADALARHFKEERRDLCLILDDLDRLPTEVARLLGAELRRFWNLRLEREELRRFQCVLFGGMDLHYLTAGDYSPLSNVLNIFHMEDLNAEQAAQNLAGNLGLPQLDHPATEALYEETAGHPSLVVAIANQLQESGATPSAEAIHAAAQCWVERCVSEETECADPCFEETLRFLKTNRLAYRTVLKLLASNEVPLGSKPEEEVLMSGAVAWREAGYVFRGRMYEEALKGHFNPLRQADYWCLHGELEKALALYRGVPVDFVRAHRIAEMKRSSRRILDLVLGVTPAALEWRRLERAERFVAEMGRHLFGANRATLWGLEPQEKEAAVRARYPKRHKSPEQTSFHGTATQAARHHSLTTLQSNRGIILGIGATAGTSRWALQFDFAEGIPGEAVEANLRQLEPSFFMVLDHARQQDLNENRLQAQRQLIHRINLRLQRSTTLEEVFQAIVNGIRDEVGYECAQLSLVFPEEDLIRAVAANGKFDLIKEMTVRDLKGPDLLAQVYRRKKAWNVTDCSDPQFHCDRDTIKITGFKSNAVLPLMDGDMVLGVLQVGDSTRTFAFRQVDMELLQPLADCAAVAINRVRERKAVEIGLEAAGVTMAVVDTTGRIVSCGKAYEEFFGVKPGVQTTVRNSLAADAEPLVETAFRQGHPVHTVRDRQGRKHEVTAASLQDARGRHAGGVELLTISGPTLGLTEALGQMVGLDREDALAQAIVDCACDHLGYARARFFRFYLALNALVSKCSRGFRKAENRRLFAEGKIVQRRALVGSPAGFEVLLDGQPHIVVVRGHADQSLPLFTPGFDSRHRMVTAIEHEDPYLVEVLEKDDVWEWIDIPLVSGGDLLAKLVVDQKGTQRRFGLQDIEFLGLFGHWAAEAYARVLSLEKARQKAELVERVRALGEDQSLESLAAAFLLNITLEGGPGFHRAILFLKQSKSGEIRGFQCQGAPDGKAWAETLPSVRVDGRRQDYLEMARRNRADGKGINPEDERRLRALQAIIFREEDARVPLGEAIRGRQAVEVHDAGNYLGWLYAALDWAAAPRALVCPLIHKGQCEGVLYVDRAFEARGLSDDDRKLLDTLASHFASVAYPALQLGDQLRSQVLGVSHTLVSPISSVRALAETLPMVPESERGQYLELIVAESDRAARTARNLLRVAAGGSASLSPKRQRFDLVLLLEERLKPYLALLRLQGVKPEVNFPANAIPMDGDRELLGDALAELADNALTALQASSEPPEEHVFAVVCALDSTSQRCQVVFTNSGRRVPSEIQGKLFDRFVSGSGGTGLGLSMVQEILEMHGARIDYTSTAEGWSKFTVDMAAVREDSK